MPPSATPILSQPAIDGGSIDTQDTSNNLWAFAFLNALHGTLTHRVKSRVIQFSGIASNDQFDGRAIAVMAASGSVGGVDRDILSTPSAAEHALVMGVLRVASGQYRTKLVVSWSPTEASSLSEVERLGADPYFHRRLPLDELSSHALQAAALANRVPAAHDLAKSILAKNRRNGARAYPSTVLQLQKSAGLAPSRPLPWPLLQDMAAP